MQHSNEAELNCKACVVHTRFLCRQRDVDVRTPSDDSLKANYCTLKVYFRLNAIKEVFIYTLSVISMKTGPTTE